tara:strand:+ start:3979 stop:4434 length:456 start_codon:yes stop_codon:yes gene_type:complete
MINVKYPTFTLADAIDYLHDQQYSIVRNITTEQLLSVVADDPEHKKPIYQYVSVYLRKDKKTLIHLIHSNLGYMFFKNHDILESYKLDKPEFYFDIKLEGETTIYQHDDITFSKNNKKNWDATFDYITIFDHFGLAGNDDYAPFVGFFIQV